MITIVTPTGVGLDDVFIWAKEQVDRFNVKVVVFINGKTFIVDEDTGFLDILVTYFINVNVIDLNPNDLEIPIQDAVVTPSE